MPNGVTFEIRNEESGVTKIVHHDKLKPIRGSASISGAPSSEPDVLNDDDYESWTSSASSSVHSDYSASDDSDTDDSVHEPVAGRRYPQRERRPRIIPGAIPWNAVSM